MSHSVELGAVRRHAEPGVVDADQVVPAARPAVEAGAEPGDASARVSRIVSTALRSPLVVADHDPDGKVQRSGHKRPAARAFGPSSDRVAPAITSTGSQGCVQRHASKEHYLLGSLTPGQLRAVADAKNGVDANNQARGAFSRAFGGPHQPDEGEYQMALHIIGQQLEALERWRGAGPTTIDPADVEKGSSAYSAEWGGQLVTVTCAGGEELVCTVGDLNALPDFFGSLEDVGRVSRPIAHRVFQAIRRETYVYLKTLEAQMEGRKYSYDKEGEAFTGIEDSNVGLHNAALPKAGNDAADVLQTAAMLRGGEGEQGLDVAIGAEATLGRNACHFPPESWLRWREHHLRARALIAGAASLADLGAAANEAIVLNAFGDHYLQDSFASGHLINKGFVMAVAMEHASGATKWSKDWTPAVIAELQASTAHEDAYEVPQAAQERQDEVDVFGGVVSANVLDDAATMSARDPQSALEHSRAAGGGVDATKTAEVAGSGIDPAVVSFEQFRSWLNDFWLQKITNTLHDKYCVNGLQVSSPHQAGMFTIYGDNNMMRSSEGAHYTAETAALSRQSINILIRNRRNQLIPDAPPMPDGAVPVAAPVLAYPSVEEILQRFPNQVTDDDGTVMSLAEWATGAPMRRKIRDIVKVMSKEFWKEGKLTALVRGVSVAKEVATGLGPDHGAF